MIIIALYFDLSTNRKHAIIQINDDVSWTINKVSVSADQMFLNSSKSSKASLRQ